MNRLFFGLLLSCLVVGTALAQQRPAGGPAGNNAAFYESFPAGAAIPDELEFYRESGELIRANSVFEKPYTVIVSGCLTCGRFRMSYQEVEAVYHDYKDKNVDFYFIYQTLMHPENHSYVQAFSMQERFLQLAVAKKEYGTNVPWLLDTFDNNWKTHFQFRPNSQIIFDGDGRIVSAEPWVQHPGLRTTLEKLIGPVKDPTTVADLNLPDVERVSDGVRTGVVERVKVDGVAVPVSFTVAQSDNTYYAKMRPEVDQELYDTGDGQMYIGLHLDPIYEVHWNNLSKPVTYKLSLPEGVAASPIVGEGPLPDVDTDKDPREFLIDIANWTDRSEAIGVDVFYFACNEEMGWCMPVTQSYSVNLQRDRLAGTVHGRTHQVEGQQRPRPQNRPASRPDG